MDINKFQYGADPILMADLPPNPLIEADLNRYKALGMNTLILTEDFGFSFTENGIITEDYKKAIEKAREANLDVFIRNMQNDADYFQNDDPDKERSNYGTPYRLPKRNITSELSSLSGIKGFFMADEAYMMDLKDKPLFSSFDKLQKLVDWKNEYYPDLFWHMNHVGSPSYDHWMHYLGIDYEDFLQSYCDKILSRLNGGGRSLSLDFYPFAEDKEIDPDYLWNILTAAKVARRYNLSKEEKNKAIFGVCIQCHQNMSPIGLGMERDLSCKEEVSLQILCSFALGAKMLEYFCYRSLEDINMFGMLRKNSTHTYDFVKGGNEMALPFGKVTSAFEWKGAFFNPGEVFENKLAYERAKHLFLEKDTYQKDILELKSGYDLLVGGFYQDPYMEYMKGAKTNAYMLVNYTDPTLHHINKVHVKLAQNKVHLFHQGKWETVTLNEGELNLEINPGEAYFLLPDQD